MIQGMLGMIVVWICIYAALGALFAIYFVFFGARHLDPGHKHSSLLARAILMPGLVAFWPYLVVRFAIGAKFNG